MTIGKVGQSVTCAIKEKKVEPGWWPKVTWPSSPLARKYWMERPVGFLVVCWRNEGREKGGEEGYRGRRKREGSKR
jgi:hypothetical protein